MNDNLSEKRDARWFYSEFVNSIKWENDARAYLTDAEFTPVVTKAIREIVDSVPGWNSQTEYFRIDVIGWETRWNEVADIAHKADLSAHLWDLKIAVEHENSKSDWTDELVKLMQVRCPLKVVIGYNYYDDRDQGEQNKLKAAAAILRQVRSYQSCRRDHEEILLILGNGCSKVTGKSDYTEFDYRGYLYDFDCLAFVRIE